MSKDSENVTKASNKINITAVIIGAMLVITLVAIILIIGIGNKSKSTSAYAGTEVGVENAPETTAEKTSIVDSTAKTEVAESKETQEKQVAKEEDKSNLKDESESKDDDTNGEANDESNAAEKSSFNTGYPEYDQLLGKIEVAIDAGEDSETSEYSYMYGRFGNFPNSKFGYGLLDVNNDLQYELVIGESGSEEYPSILYDMYMLDGTNLVHVFCGGERDRYYATDIQNAFIEEGSSSADDFFYDTFVVEDGKRQSVNFVVEPKKLNVELTPFKKS